MNREDLIAKAIREQRISPGQADEYRRLHASVPAATEHLLTASVEDGGLMPGLAAGHGTLSSSYDPAWLTPKERQQLAAAPTVAPAAPAPAAPARTATPAASAAASGGDEYDDT